MSVTTPERPLLEVSDLAKVYGGGLRGGGVRAVDGVSFQVQRGRTLGIVGESGCGKSTLANAVLMLDPPSRGQVVFDGQDLTGLGRQQLRRVRRDLQVIFQDPYSSLNERMTVGEILAEPLRVHERKLTAAARAERITDALVQVGLDPADRGRYPGSFSGGQRQRIGIARALIVRPKLVVCDEPVSALDVSVQAQVMNLLCDLRDDNDLTYLFISHDLSVIRQMADRVAVMYLGRIVEMGDVAEVMDNPRHPYTRALLDSVPRGRREPGRERTLLEGDLPDPADHPAGCAFASRCPKVQPDCRDAMPPLVVDGATQHAHRCRYPEGTPSPAIG